MRWFSRAAGRRPGPGGSTFVSWPQAARLTAAAVAAAGLLGAVPSGAGTLRTEQLKVGEATRTFLVMTPAGEAGPRPVVIALHGAMQTPESFRAYFGLDAAAEAHGFVAVYPGGEGRVWNDGRPAAMRLKAMLQPGDDVPFLVQLARKLVADGIADPGRIYLTGISNGGFMVERMACEHAGLFAAFSLVMATAPANYREECHPARPVPILFIHSTADNVVAYDGFWTPLGATLSAPDSARLFARLNGCGAETRRDMPDLDLLDGTSVSELRWSACREGADVVLLRVAGGGHQPPVRVETTPDLAVPFLGLRNHDIDAGEEVWRFMSAFSLPPAADGTGAPAKPAPGIAAGPAPTRPMPADVPLPVPVQRGMSTQ